MKDERGKIKGEIKEKRKMKKDKGKNR